MPEDIYGPIVQRIRLYTSFVGESIRPPDMPPADLGQGFSKASDKPPGGLWFGTTQSVDLKARSSSHLPPSAFSGRLASYSPPVSRQNCRDGLPVVARIVRQEIPAWIP